MSMYLCPSCDALSPEDVYMVTNMQAEAYEISYCPFCGVDVKSLIEFSDEDEVYSWFENDMEEGEKEN